ncbi:hypothetical protein DC498_04655 [Terrimonas sp.]|nr:hypothetical protein DC498_04655 [Terrimonas sp.]
MLKDTLLLFSKQLFMKAGHFKEFIIYIYSNFAGNFPGVVAGNAECTMSKQEAVTGNKTSLRSKKLLIR